jgi:hypothetical protein
MPPVFAGLPPAPLAPAAALVPAALAPAAALDPELPALVPEPPAPLLAPAPVPAPATLEPPDGWSEGDSSELQAPAAISASAWTSPG